MDALDDISAVIEHSPDVLRINGTSEVRVAVMVRTGGIGDFLKIELSLSQYMVILFYICLNLFCKFPFLPRTNSAFCIIIFLWLIFGKKLEFYFRNSFINFKNSWYRLKNFMPAYLFKYLFYVSCQFLQKLNFFIHSWINFNKKAKKIFIA